VVAVWLGQTHGDEGVLRPVVAFKNVGVADGEHGGGREPVLERLDGGATSPWSGIGPRRRTRTGTRRPAFARRAEQHGHLLWGGSLLYNGGDNAAGAQTERRGGAGPVGGLLGGKDLTGRFSVRHRGGPNRRGPPDSHSLLRARASRSRTSPHSASQASRSSGGSLARASASRRPLRSGSLSQCSSARTPAARAIGLAP